jgi:hypothetical protein
MSHKFPGKQKHIPHGSIYITHGVITIKILLTTNLIQLTEGVEGGGGY